MLFASDFVVEYLIEKPFLIPFTADHNVKDSAAWFITEHSGTFA
jgi:hypothetical protein